ncbi:hypothetical protein CA601_18135 [Paraburkholderia hospita]|nr:hypothetical protein CA601_18135 [Paraburkholderia hospita]
MTNPPNRPDFSEDNGIAAVDLIGFFKSYFAWIVGVALIAAALAYAVSLALPSQWLATGVIQLGQVGQLEDRSPIDTPARALARLQSQDFQNQILVKLGLPLELGASRDAFLLRNTLTGQSQPSSDLIMINARGYSPELAKKTVTEARDAIIASDAQLFAPYLDRTQKRLASLETEIQNAEHLLNSGASIATDNAAAARSGDAGQGVVSSLLGNMLQSDLRQQQVNTRKFLEDLQQQRLTALRQLDPVYAYNTRPVTEVTVSMSPVAPHRSVITAFGGVVGLVFGIVTGLFWHARRRRLRA